MAYQNPTPGRKPRGAFSEAIGSVVQMEKIVQIVLVLPCAVLIGWGAGMWLDDHFHQSWMTLTGFVLGCIAGFSSVIKMAMQTVNEPGKRSDSGADAKGRDSNDPQ